MTYDKPTQSRNQGSSMLLNNEEAAKSLVVYLDGNNPKITI